MTGDAGGEDATTKMNDDARQEVQRKEKQGKYSKHAKYIERK